MKQNSGKFNRSPFTTFTFFTSHRFSYNLHRWNVKILKMMIFFFQQSQLFTDKQTKMFASFCYYSWEKTEHGSGNFEKSSLLFFHKIRVRRERRESHPLRTISVCVRVPCVDFNEDCRSKYTREICEFSFLAFLLASLSLNINAHAHHIFVCINLLVRLTIILRLRLDVENRWSYRCLYRRDSIVAQRVVYEEKHLVNVKIVQFSSKLRWTTVWWFPLLAFGVFAFTVRIHKIEILFSILSHFHFWWLTSSNLWFFQF